MVWKLSFACNSLLFLIGFTLEIMGIGLITSYRENEMYYFIEVSGFDWLYVLIYSLFFFLLPVINLVAILVNPIRIKQF